MIRKPPPLSLYLHFPWCISKCPYCDFNSHSLKGDLPAETYVDALLAEVTAVADSIAKRPIISVFMGGGTPSLFPPAELDRLLAGIATKLQLSHAAEITMEANPGAVEHAALSDYRAAGINRLSLGVQSFADDKLAGLGRIHSSDDARAAFREARAAGFDNINLDIMYALPEQSVAQAEADVQFAIELAPEHISHYHLTLEPNTVFYARPPRLPDGDSAWDMQTACAARLQAAGYGNYEVSAWAQPDRECRHNLNYWQYGDYLGLGAGAHGKLTDAAGQVGRQVRAAHPRAYLQQVQTGDPAVVSSTVSPAELSFEFLLNALRLKKGFTLALFEAHTGLQPDSIAAELAAAEARNLLVKSAGGRYAASAHGWRFLDDLQAIFLPQS